MFCLDVCLSAHQKRSSDPTRLQLQMVVSQRVLVGIELRTSEGADSALNH